LENMAVKKSKVSWKGKSVLVTGHEGFIGSWLTKNLIHHQAKVIGLDKVQNRQPSVLDSQRSKFIGIKGNVANFSLLKRLVNKYQPQVVFHLAAQPIVGQALASPLEVFNSNIRGTWNVLEVNRFNRKLESMVVASSDKAYGTQKKLPYTEEAPLQGEFPYEVSKSCADLIAQSYYKTYNLPVGVSRCGNVYGPGDHHFSRLVPEAIKCALKGEKLLIRSDGHYTRDFNYVADIVEGYLLLAGGIKEKKLAGQAFNFSNNQPISVLELVKLIFQLCGREPNYRILNAAKKEIRDQYLDASKANQLLGWRSKYSLSQGLRETIKWYQGIFNV
jgi:CDP-glucose 4,6-dehydratase